MLLRIPAIVLSLARANWNVAARRVLISRAVVWLFLPRSCSDFFTRSIFPPPFTSADSRMAVSRLIRAMLYSAAIPEISLRICPHHPQKLPLNQPQILQQPQPVLTLHALILGP